MTRLSATSRIGPAVTAPGYEPRSHATGIVHIGVGAFHKAHQAVYTDSALAAAGGDWRIIGVSLRSADVAAALNPQEGRYILITRDEAGDSAQLISSIDRVLVAPDDPQAVIEAIADPATKIVTLTVTEKGYGIDRASGGLDRSHAAVAHDLANPEKPVGVIGFLVAGLSARMERGIGGLTILCCDNLPENGHITARLVTEFAAQIDEKLATWISDEVRFPSSMVDRITPASTARTFEDAQRLSGYADEAAVETEPFTQWVIEDNFRAERPAWESAGALFVDDVAPYEQMKLRLLNGTHSMLAYAGYLAGHETISEAVRDTGLHALAERQMIAAATTLPPVPGIDLDAYRAQLLARFSNRAIRHLTYQIAMDGTEKLPQRILAPLAETVKLGGDGTPFCFAIAAWMRYCMGVSDKGETYALRDPREHLIAPRVEAAGRDPALLYDALSSLPGLFPPALAGNETVRACVVSLLASLLENGMAGAIAQQN
ncbi:mannitol dehydrogenase family protein [Pseudaminobacter arsenicus]|uniref:Mannitol dehydrogenase family protein n=1 Tax=Borborobacter arsenicus TaxID=1851146 RepID=A0A432V7Q8_9HYPH|nr:mannitol dehydrogenase family protein [Pseudaminobacter arsenicus]RUM98194.1 mannitol dehydrogenase family protein [Pseudaminobacter arsenicus]